MDDLFLEFDAPKGNYKLIIEDNGRVAYAYLSEGSKIAGDVWLYNRFPAPEKPEWRDRSKIPFLNPVPYVVESDFHPLTDNNEVSCEWLYENGTDSLDRVLIFVRGQRFAEIGLGMTPGYSVLAKKDGPLAKVLS